MEKFRHKPCRDEERQAKKMKKASIKVISLVLGCLLVLSMVLFEAKAEPMTGVVVCSGVSLRKAMDTNAQRYKSLSNGTEVSILAMQGDWYVIDLTSVDEGEGEGYVLKKYVKANPYYITLPATVTLWADTWGSGVAVGEKVQGTEMLVLSETAEWYCVQCREKSAGSAFIKKAEMNGMIGSQPENVNGQQTVRRQAVVICQSLAVRREPVESSEYLGTLHNEDLVMRLGDAGNGYEAIEYTLSGQTIVAYVHSKYLIDVYNK